MKPEVAERVLDLVLSVEEALSRLPPGGSSRPEFYELLYRTASRLGPTDAFYACLYDEHEATLYFPCNWEGERFETCEIKPLGTGPTSWTIRNRKTYVLDQDAGAIQHSRNRFGNVSRPSLSAIHAPMLAADLDGQVQIYGVISMQSYEPMVYDEQVVRLFEWLACRAGAALQRDRDRAERASTTQARRLQEQTNEFNRVLKEITRRADEVQARAGSGGREVQDAVAALCRACYQGQSQAVIFARQAAPASEERREQPDPFLQLTPQERRVLGLLCRHRTYRQIGLELCVEPSTVKSHVASILRKLHVSTRSEAADLAEPFLVRHEG